MFLCNDPSYRDYGNKGIKEDKRGRMCIYAHTRAREDTRYISMLKDEKRMGKRKGVTCLTGSVCLNLFG